VNILFRDCICAALLSATVPLLYASGAQEKTEVQYGKLTETASFFFELTRFTATGYSLQDNSAYYCSLCLLPVKLLLRTEWKEDRTTSYFVEVLQPSVTGIIDSTFCPGDLLPSGTKETTAITAVDIHTLFSEAEQSSVPVILPPSELSASPASSATAESSGITESPSEYRYRDAESRLRLFTYGTEIFSADEFSDGKRILVSSDGKYIDRRFFDSMMRLTLRETWKTGTNSSDAVITRTQNFFYQGDSLVPSSSTNTSDSFFEIIDYNNKSRPVSCRSYLIKAKDDKDLKEKETEHVKIQNSLTTWKYTDDGKITEEEYTKYDDRGIYFYFVRKDKYIYKESKQKNCPPDYEYYENGVLHMKTVYETVDRYETSVYFDNGYTVQTEFEHGKKTKEILMRNGREVRSHFYEN
jgi:hypothetical protein